jgi:hypothetical protein
MQVHTPMLGFQYVEVSYYEDKSLYVGSWMYLYFFQRIASGPLLRQRLSLSKIHTRYLVLRGHHEVLI